MALAIMPTARLNSAALHVLPVAVAGVVASSQAEAVVALPEVAAAESRGPVVLAPTRPTPNPTQLALRAQFANRIPTPLMNALITMLQKTAGS